MNIAPQIFLSYAREDADRVEDLYRRLTDVGFRPWIDIIDILPGERWETCIQRAIRRSDFFLACLSENAINKRGFLQKEIKAALDIWQEKLERDIYLIPVRLEDCQVPETLRDFQWVDLFESDGWSRLERAIQAGIERRSEEELKPAWRSTEVDGLEPNQRLQLDLQPRVLAEGDNQVDVIVWNRSKSICESVSIRVKRVENLYVGSEERIWHSRLQPDESLRDKIELTALDVGTAEIELKCSWKHGNRTYSQDWPFQFEVSEQQLDTSVEISDNSSYVSSDLKEHYWRELPRWKQQLEVKEEHCHHLELQADMLRPIVPFHIARGIESLKREISELRKNIEEAEAYLGRNT